MGAVGAAALPSQALTRQLSQRESPSGGGASEKALHERNIAGGAGRDSLFPQDGKDGLGQGAQHLEAAPVVHTGVLEAGGAEGAVGLEVLTLEVDGHDLVAVPAADFVPEAALRVHRGVLGADVVCQIADDPQVGAGDGVQHHPDGLGGVHGVVVDALHREEHALLLADGQDLAQAAKECFLRFPAADGGLLCHVGGLAAHAAGAESLCHRHLTQGLRHLGAALVLVRIAQLNVGALHGDGHAALPDGGIGGGHQLGGHVCIAFDALHGLGVGQLGAAEPCVPDGAEQFLHAATAKIVAPCADDEFRHPASSLRSAEQTLGKHPELLAPPVPVVGDVAAPDFEVAGEADFAQGVGQSLSVGEGIALIAALTHAEKQTVLLGLGQNIPVADAVLVQSGEGAAAEDEVVLCAAEEAAHIVEAGEAHCTRKGPGTAQAALDGLIGTGVHAHAPDEGLLFALGGVQLRDARGQLAGEVDEILLLHLGPAAGRRIAGQQALAVDAVGAEELDPALVQQTGRCVGHPVVLPVVEAAAPGGQCQHRHTAAAVDLELHLAVEHRAPLLIISAFHHENAPPVR